jgi:hypothetical protein
MKTIGYVRVSTERQAERGISLEAQAEKIRAMALVQGVELADIIVESGESAKSLNRTGMSQLLAMVEAGKVKAVIVAKLDRLTRSVKDLRPAEKRLAAGLVWRHWLAEFCHGAGLQLWPGASNRQRARLCANDTGPVPNPQRAGGDGL